MDAITSVNKLQVFFRQQLVGTLGRTPDHTRCTFQYAKEWLQSGFSISPLGHVGPRSMLLKLSF